LPTPNYAFAKRQRDLAKKAKKEGKLKRKGQAGADGTTPVEPGNTQDQATAPAVEKQPL
jgi:hypothetical protein